MLSTARMDLWAGSPTTLTTLTSSVAGKTLAEVWNRLGTDRLGEKIMVWIVES